ncbi:Alpha/Beta hydrolase protein [Xylariomycetidae sp. FL2044]|nr:Alpha/Beta hydrolase protein [Xylariomycetidae sp. FL2044]
MIASIRTLFLSTYLITIFAFASPLNEQHPLESQDGGPTTKGISIGFFASLERLSRLVDIAYCVGTTGISQPFACASRCKEFPTLELITTWNTGVLMSDSCGYVAINHGSRPPLDPHAAEEGAPHYAGSEVEREIIVAFRGTYSVTNTVVDLSTVPQEYVPYPSPEDGGDKPPEEPEHRCYNCTVHMGFLQSWQVAREEVLATVKALHEQHPDHTIHLVGHSLGGAVAALAALEMKVILGWDKLVVTTFGEPRVGNIGFVQYLNAVFELDVEKKPSEMYRYRRITHVDDPVPLLPLSEWTYRSHAGEIFISKAELSPEPSDIWTCVGDYDPSCIAGSAGEDPSLYSRAILELEADEAIEPTKLRARWDIPARYKLWQLFFAHRDYFWRLGLCVPGGDPIDWGRDRYPNLPTGDEL